jgi:hypothetical protein
MSQMGQTSGGITRAWPRRCVGPNPASRGYWAGLRCAQSSCSGALCAARSSLVPASPSHQYFGTRRTVAHVARPSGVGSSARSQARVWAAFTFRPAQRSSRRGGRMVSSTLVNSKPRLIVPRAVRGSSSLSWEATRRIVAPCHSCHSNQRGCAGAPIQRA